MFVVARSYEALQSVVTDFRTRYSIVPEQIDDVNEILYAFAYPPAPPNMVQPYAPVFVHMVKC